MIQIVGCRESFQNQEFEVSAFFLGVIVPFDFKILRFGFKSKNVVLTICYSTQFIQVWRFLSNLFIGFENDKFE